MIDSVILYSLRHDLFVTIVSLIQNSVRMVSSKVIFCVVLVTLLVVCCCGQDVDDKGCITYDQQEKAGFSTGDKKVRIPAKNKGYEITEILLIDRKSFYSCKQGKNFGHTKTDWFVAKGCEAIFKIKECPL